MIKALPILLLFILLLVGPWYFFKNPFDAAYCLMSGEEWARQGKNGRYCKEVFSDGGSTCSKNSQCKSGKCVIGSFGKMSGVHKSTSRVVPHEEIALGVFNNITDDAVLGRCAETNQDPCFSGEMTIDENRIIHTPKICE